MPLTEKQKIDAALTKARTELARTRHHREAMAIAERRKDLIEKSFVSRQAQYIFLCLRASILAFPAKYGRHVLGLSDEHRAREILTRVAHEFLGELANFDEKAIDPGWMQALEGDGDATRGDKAPSTGQPKAKARPPATGAQIKAEMEKAKIRRAKKTETMRRLRAKG